MGIQIGPSNIQDIDGILWGWCWQWNNGDHAVLTYSFPTSRQVYLDQGYADVQGFQAFNATQKAAAIKVLANYDAVCNLDFVYEPNPYNGNIRFAEASYFDDGNGFQNVNNTTIPTRPFVWILALGRRHPTRSAPISTSAPKIIWRGDVSPTQSIGLVTCAL